MRYQSRRGAAELIRRALRARVLLASCTMLACLAGLALGLYSAGTAAATSALVSGTTRSHLSPLIQQGEALTRESAQRHHFGSSVALSENGNTALVSEEGQDAVWVFTRSGLTWTEQAELKSPDGETASSFGEAAALSADGDTALISDPSHQINACTGVCCGVVVIEPREEPKYTEAAVWVFTRSGATWSESEKLVPSAGAERKGGTRGFGYAIALSNDGDTALIGASSETAAWVFARSGSTWSQAAKLVGGEGAFGEAVALSADGDTALVGETNGNGGQHGSAWVFARSGSSWSEDERLEGSGRQNGAFGRSVALSGDGDTALISGSVEEKTSVTVFTRSGSTWTAGEKLTAVGSNSIEELGAWEMIVKISSDGDSALVSGAGETRERHALPVWGFTHSGSTWSEGEKLAGGEGDFGASVALSGEGSTALIGEPVEYRREPVECKGVFEPLDAVEPNAVRDVVQQAATANQGEESGRVWVFQEGSRRPSSERIPHGVKLIQVVKHWGGKLVQGGYHLSTTITKPAAVHSVIAAVEALKPPPSTTLKCGRLELYPTRIDIYFRAASRGEALAKLELTDQCGPMVRMWVRGSEQPYLRESACLQLWIQTLLGQSKHPSSEPRPSLTCESRAPHVISAPEDVDQVQRPGVA